MNRIQKWVIILLFSKIGYAQDISQLKTYLANHRVPIIISESQKPNELFKSIMLGKNLFVFGEGGSHGLELNNQLRVYLLNQFSFLNLKYFFIEYGRSIAYLNNQYLQNITDNADSIFKTDSSYKMQMRKIRALYQSGAHFEYKGIDMEQYQPFYFTIKGLEGIDNPSVQSTRFIDAVLRDTSYLHYNDKNYFTNQKHFLPYYKSFKKKFINDSATLKDNLPTSSFQVLRYFLSNPQTKPPTGNRNKGMAKNLLSEITPIDSNATYILGIGLAHSLLNRDQSVVGILSKSEFLAKKIVIMNVYCDHCTVNGEEINDHSLKFMEKEVLEAFRSSAKTELTIFDLSKVPAQLAYLKKYGDLILFGKNQK